MQKKSNVSKNKLMLKKEMVTKLHPTALFFINGGGNVDSLKAEMILDLCNSKECNSHCAHCPPTNN